MRIDRFAFIEILSCAVVSVGTILDHISTRVALSLPYTYETNPFVVMLISRGLWVPFECAMIALATALPLAIIHLKRGGVYRALLAYPLALGLVRLVACFWNLSIIHSVLQLLV